MGFPGTAAGWLTKAESTWSQSVACWGRRPQGGGLGHTPTRQPEASASKSWSWHQSESRRSQLSWNLPNNTKKLCEVNTVSMWNMPAILYCFPSGWLYTSIITMPCWLVGGGFIQQPYCFLILKGKAQKSVHSTSKLCDLLLPDLLFAIIRYQY